MKNIFYLTFYSCLFSILVTSCADDVDRTIVGYSADEYAILSQHLNLPEGLHEYGKDQGSFVGMEHMPSNGNIFGTEDIILNYQATLGRVLFYDTRLSINDKVSCASCHQQQLAFADNVELSVGFDGELSLRNSLPLGNTVGFDLAYGGGSFAEGNIIGNFGPIALFGWDESNINISSQSSAAITSTVEMGMHDVDDVISKIKNDPSYEILFRKAFGTNSIDADRMLSALDKFVNSISSNNSRFDKAAPAMDGGQFTELINDFDDFTNSENNGKLLYLQNCASCHSMAHSFTARARANNGLDVIYEDNGVGKHTGLQHDNGVFKVPFLRNIELTAPYMHDGRFASLDEVIDFYSEGIQQHENLDEFLKDASGAAKQLNFSGKEKADLKAYLLTLTDEELISDPKWSDPFK